MNQKIFSNNYLYQLLFLAVLLVVVLLVFFPYSIQLPLKYLHILPTEQYPSFLVQSDYVQQYIPFYEEFFRLLDGGSLAWSANEMFGINFYASKAYYLIGDPFAWLMYGLHRFISNTADILLVVTILKLVLSGYSANYFFKQLDIKPNVRLIYSVLYMLSGWMTIFIEQPVFISFYVVAPLLIASFIKTIKANKPILLVTISAALCISVQYYLTWMICVLILIGWIIYHLVSHTSLKDFLTLSIKTLLYFLLGVGCSAVIWLPSILHMIQNPRLGSGELNTYWTYDFSDYLNIIKNAYIPVLKYADHSYRNYWYYFYQTGIYAGVINTLVLPLYFLDQHQNSEAKKIIGLILIILLITLVSPQISKVFHFTYSLRYTYGFMLILLVIGALWFNQNKHDITKKAILFNGLLQAIICLSLGVLWPLSQGSTISTPDVKLSFISCGLIILYTGLLFLSKVKVKVTSLALSVLILIGSTFYGYYALKGQSENALAYAPFLSKQDEFEATWSALKEYDPSVYRVQLVNCELNDNLVYGIPSTSTYNSVYQYTLHDFLQWIRQYPDVSWSFNIDVPDLDPLLNVKYIILNEPTPEQVGYYKYWADEVSIEAPLTVLQLKELTSFARTITQLDTVDSINGYNDETIPLNGLLIELKDTIIVDESLFDQLAPYVISQDILYQPTEYSSNQWSMNVDVQQEDYLLFVAQSYDQGWSYHSDTGSTIPSYSVHGGFTALKVPANTHTITATYNVPGFNFGFSTSLVSSLTVLILWILKSQRRTNNDQ